MHNDNHHQAAPGEKAKREFSKAVDSINASILAAGGTEINKAALQRLQEIKSRLAAAAGKGAVWTD